MLVRLLLCCILMVPAGIARSEAPVTEFPFEYREGLLWVRVRLSNNPESLLFLLDSGAEVSVVNLSTARRLGLALGRKVKVRGVETSVTGYWPQPLHASAGNVTLPSSVLALDLSKLSGSCERTVDGLVGADFFKNKIVQLDFRARKVRVLQPKDLEPTGASLPLMVLSSGMRVNVRINKGKPVWLRVDTGCSTCLQWVTTTARVTKGGDKIAVGLAKLSIPQAHTMVELGDRTFRAVPTGIHRRAIFPGESGLLGNGLLAQFDAVTFDGRGHRLVLEGGEQPASQTARQIGRLGSRPP